MGRGGPRAEQTGAVPFQRPLPAGREPRAPSSSAGGCQRP